MVTLRYRSTLRFPLGFYMESRASQEPRRWISCFRALSEPLAGAAVQWPPAVFPIRLTSAQLVGTPSDLLPGLLVILRNHLESLGFTRNHVYYSYAYYSYY